MDKRLVSIVRYDDAGRSVERAVALCDGLKGVPRDARTFIKPNIVFWTRRVPFPKWGVVTTSRVVADAVAVLKAHGIERVTIGEGMVTYDPEDRATPADAFETLGYRRLEERYGVRCINIHERPFRTVDLGDGIRAKVNADILESDLVVDLPVLKTHSQTVVSLGVKNLKGCLDIPSRKAFHDTRDGLDLHRKVAGLPGILPERSLTIVDGIFTNERGPGFDGRIRRKDILVASADWLSADLVGAALLGYTPEEVPHLDCLVKRMGRAPDLGDIEIRGEKIEDLRLSHAYAFPYTKDGSLPMPMKRMGVEGLAYRQYDQTLCTYCALLSAAVLPAVARAWKGQPWDKVEVLTGKVMSPTRGKKKTILLGKCMYLANRNHPDIAEMFTVKSCPPSPEEVVDAFHRAGIPIERRLIEDIEAVPGWFMQKYEGQPEFDEGLFRIP